MILLMLLLCIRYAMKQPLPVGGFRWVPDDQHKHLIDRILLSSDHPNHVGVDNDVGYILEVDLEYPAGLHDNHNDLPLAPEKVRIVE